MRACTATHTSGPASKREGRPLGQSGIGDVASDHLTGQRSPHQPAGGHSRPRRAVLAALGCMLRARGRRQIFELLASVGAIHYLTVRTQFSPHRDTQRCSTNPEPCDCALGMRREVQRCSRPDLCSVPNHLFTRALVCSSFH